MILWIACGLLTAWLMYHKKEEIPVVKSILVALFGVFSLIVWALFNLGYKINNPMIKQEPVVIPTEPAKVVEFEAKTKKKK